MNIGARVTIVHGWLSQNHGLVSGVLIAKRDCNGQEVLTVELDKPIDGRRIYTLFPEEIVAEGQWPNVYGDHVWPGMGWLEPLYACGFLLAPTSEKKEQRTVAAVKQPNEGRS